MQRCRVKTARFERPPCYRLPILATGVVVIALVFEPLAGRIAGRGWRQVEVLGLTPNPTAIATLAFLALSTARPHRALSVIRAVWCAIGAATLWTLESSEAWLVMFVGLVGLILAIRREPEQPRSRL